MFIDLRHKAIFSPLSNWESRETSGYFLLLTNTYTKKDLICISLIKCFLLVFLSSGRKNESPVCHILLKECKGGGRYVRTDQWIFI